MIAFPLDVNRATQLLWRARVLGGVGSGNFGHSGRPGEIGGSGESGDFVRQITSNLAATSRTSAGVETPFAGKPSLTLHGDSLANKVEMNTRDAAAFVFAQKDADLNAADVHRVVEEVGSRINHGLLDGPLYRQFEKNERTSPAQIPKKLAAFEREFAQRVDDPDAVATAAWVERTFDSQIHPFSDGVGRSSKLLSGLVLARAGHALPRYRDRNEYYAQIEKPLSEFTTYYRGLFSKVKHLGGAGSGNFGHAGRPGEIGGSGESGSALPSNASSVVAAVQAADGGFTYHAVTGEQPTTGFALSIHPDREQIVDAADVNLVTLATYAAKNHDLLRQSNKYMGAWHNPTDHKVYLDVSTVVSSAADAERQAVAAHQFAYFDLAKGQSVTVASGRNYVSKAAEAHAALDWPQTRRADARRFDRARQETDRPRSDARRNRASPQDLLLTRALSDALLTLGGPGSGNFGHAGRPGEVGGSAESEGESASSDTATSTAVVAPEDVEFHKTTPEERAIAHDQKRVKEIEKEWASVNRQLLLHVNDEDADLNSPEVKALYERQKELVKEHYTLKADPGGLEGLYMPGGVRDVVVIGAGPAGFASSVMAGSEQLDTLLIEAQPITGGQSRGSSRIENLPGYPIGIKGSTLAARMQLQSERMGAEHHFGSRVSKLEFDPETHLKTILYENGRVEYSRSVIIAGGVDVRKATFPGADSGAIVYTNADIDKAGKGKPIAVLGGSNGAAQAALAAAEISKHVTLIHRGSIDDSMSTRQASAIRTHPNITVKENTEVSSFHRDTLHLKDGGTVPAEVVGVFFGGKPRVDFVPGQIQRNKDTNALHVDPLTNETIFHDRVTNKPISTGIFAAGDIRQGSIPRVGFAIGDGQMALSGAFKYFNSLKTHPTPVFMKKS